MSIHEKKQIPVILSSLSSWFGFRPIMMTTMAALMGTLPIALGLGGLFGRGNPG